MPERPRWLTVRAPSGPDAERVAEALARRNLRTVCRDARCPNVGECWNRGTATVIVLGPACTRGCAFCSVTPGAPSPPDPDEPRRVGEVAAELRWRHVVVTSVTRDDLPDGGASHFARVVAELRALSPGSSVELLVPDFRGDPGAIAAVVRAGPDVLAHNVETVPRLYPAVRPGADYRRSLGLLALARALSPALPLKSGLMAGFGETRDEIVAVLRDLREAGVTIATIGQYLAPSKAHPAPARYLSPGEFEEIAGAAREMGFPHVASAPLVRSSYRAESQL